MYGNSFVKRSKKGHASEAQVSSGLVKAEDKEGNGEADDAANSGAKDEQKSLVDLAAIYSGKQSMYKQTDD